MRIKTGEHTLSFPTHFPSPLPTHPPDSFAFELGIRHHTKPSGSVGSYIAPFLSKRIMFTALALLSVLLATTTVSAQKPSFTKLFDGFLDIDRSRGSIPGPFGGRLIAGFTGGNLTDASSGALVANIVPNFGGEFGLVVPGNRAYTDVRLAAQFVDDEAAFAFLDFQGAGSLDDGKAYNYVRLETSSTRYASLVEDFLVIWIDVSQSPSPMTVYKLSDEV
ncbi:hypothetical protein CYLTODRAFT_492346 [Cylindrobasidium torrendii FP15055 ss-10]|uniref:Uncharacterized protein n=1 Tax=Cylindrobasidium torrendii FP15055 ss-10 TaxID=1314674 RepID=A0A0D7B5B7_9AGAR|nr:hypothetical protein CYLTODRAFT_492346 [Cylindrobasidium torrendii FP15055 ss-10]